MEEFSVSGAVWVIWVVDFEDWSSSTSFMKNSSLDLGPMVSAQVLKSVMDERVLWLLKKFLREEHRCP